MILLTLWIFTVNSYLLQTLLSPRGSMPGVCAEVQEQIKLLLARAKKTTHSRSETFGSSSVAVRGGGGGLQIWREDVHHARLLSILLLKHATISPGLMKSPQSPMFWTANHNSDVMLDQRSMTSLHFKNVQMEPMIKSNQIKSKFSLFFLVRYRLFLI